SSPPSPTMPFRAVQPLSTLRILGRVVSAFFALATSNQQPDWIRADTPCYGLIRATRNTPPIGRRSWKQPTPPRSHLGQATKRRTSRLRKPTEASERSEQKERRARRQDFRPWTLDFQPQPLA